MWETAQAEATLPAQDLDRAKAFYSEKLGLTPTSEDKVGVHFVVGGTRFRLFRSGGTASGTHTQLALIVSDIAGQVRALQSRGLRFEDYDYPNLKTIEGRRPGLRESGVVQRQRGQLAGDRPDGG